MENPFNEQEGIPCVTLDVVKVPSVELFAAAYAQKVYRKLAPVKFELRKLIEDGHIEQFPTGCRIADPFLAEFLRAV